MFFKETVMIAKIIIRLGITFISRIKSNLRYLRNGIYVHPLSTIGGNTTIGHGTKINGPAFIVSTKEAPVFIGKNCAIGYNLRIINRNHYTGYINIQGAFQRINGFPDIVNSIKGPLTIGNNVWIGDNVIILSGVKIGNGAVIGAGSVVTKAVPSFSIVAGNPAKIIKYRYTNELINELDRIEWWNWTQEKIHKNRIFFETDFYNLTTENIDKILQKIDIDPSN